MNTSEFFKRLSGNRRTWRTALALLFLLPVLLVLPHARSLVVRNAVITSYLGDIKSPINGRIEHINFPPGSLAKAHVPAIVIHNDRISRGNLAQLEARHQAAELEVDRMRASLERVHAMAASRHTDLEEIVEAIAADLNRQLQQADNEAHAREADLQSASSALQRAQALNQQKLLSEAAVEIAEAAYENALAARSGNRLTRKRLAQQLEEIRRDVFQIDLPDGVLFTRQLVQQLDLEVIQLERQLRASEAELQSLGAEYTAAATAFERASVADVEVQAGSGIWNVYTTAGTWTTEGSTLLSVVNCERLLVDIAVDDATLELIEPGQGVRVRLFGTFNYLAGEVVLVRGSAGLGDLPVLAAEVQDRGYRNGRVLARLDPSQPAGKPGQSCAIGRTAYAEFEDINLFQMLFYPLFR